MKQAYNIKIAISYEYFSRNTHSFNAIDRTGIVVPKLFINKSSSLITTIIFDIWNIKLNVKNASSTKMNFDAFSPGQAPMALKPISTLRMIIFIFYGRYPVKFNANTYSKNVLQYRDIALCCCSLPKAHRF